jgi:alkylhydroperoxidase family enzyme
VIPIPKTPRIYPVTEAELDDDMRAVLDDAGPNFTGLRLNIFDTLLRHPVITFDYRRFGLDLRKKGELPARHREFLTLRTCWRCRTPYEWGMHTHIARQEAGLTPEDIAKIAAFPIEGGLTPLEASLLRAVDELHDTACISDETWAVLADNYNDHQLIEVVMIVGNYHLLSYFMNSLGVQPEDGFVPGVDYTPPE